MLEPRVTAALLAVSVVLAGNVRAETPAGPPTDEQIKSHFIVTTARFVTWPAAAFRSGTDPVVFGVVGDDALAASLETMLAGRTLGGRGVRLERLRDAASSLSCHVVFIGREAAMVGRETLDRLRKRAVLTVGDAEVFARQGGIMGMRLEQGLVQFEVNLAASRRAGLEISSKLLRLGAVVGDRRREAAAR